MKKFLLLLVIFFAANFSFAQSIEWFTVSYKYYSGPVSPQFQKNYTITINKDRSATISYHQGIDKMAPHTEDFTISKTKSKKLTRLIKKTGIFDGTAPKDSADRKIGGPEKSITISYGNPNPNLDQPIRQVTFNESSYSSDEIKRVFAFMDKIVPKKVWKKLEKHYYKKKNDK